MEMDMNITVIGCGRWGSLITWYLASRKHQNVTLYGIVGTPQMDRFLKERRNDLLVLPDSVRLSTNLCDCILPETDAVIISVGAQNLRGLMEELTAHDLRG